MVSPEGEVSTSLVVMIVKGVAEAVIRGAEETVNRGGISTDISMLTAEEEGSVTVTEEAGSTINVREHGLVITVRSVVATTKVTGGMELAHWWTQAGTRSALITGLVEGTDSVLTIVAKSAVDRGQC